jgi:hypothetical protein
MSPMRCCRLHWLASSLITSQPVTWPWCNQMELHGGKIQTRMSTVLLMCHNARKRKAIALRLVQFDLRVSTCHLIILLQNQSALFKSEFSCTSILREMHAEGSSHLLDLSLNILQVLSCNEWDGSRPVENPQSDPPAASRLPVRACARRSSA